MWRDGIPNRRLQPGMGLCSGLEELPSGKPRCASLSDACRYCSWSSDSAWKAPHSDGVRPPRRCKPADMRRAFEEVLTLHGGASIDGALWGTSPYHPTPTIIEAARALYSKHSVEAISRSDAGAKNLRVTSIALEDVVNRARSKREKAIVFLTGVPEPERHSSTHVATRRRDLGEARAVFLSGNDPLVAVLREALTRDALARLGTGVRRGEVQQPVKQFIQNVHHFRDEGIRDELAPDEHVVIFDEAQRAWNVEKTATFMKQRKGIPDFAQSEPEFLISYLDRHHDWAVIICLVGGGQRSIPVRLASQRGSRPRRTSLTIGTSITRHISPVRVPRRLTPWMGSQANHGLSVTSGSIFRLQCAPFAQRRCPRLLKRYGLRSRGRSGSADRGSPKVSDRYHARPWPG